MTGSDRRESSSAIGRRAYATLYAPDNNVNGSSRTPAMNRRTLHQDENRASRGILRGGLIVVITLSLSSLTTNAWIDRMLRRSAFVVMSGDDAIMIAPSKRASAKSTLTVPADGSATTDHSNKHRVTFVCDMACEMGNMLSHLAYCAALASWMEHVHQVGSDLVPRHNGDDGTRWESSRDDIRACFPRLSKMDFTVARTPEFSKEYDLRWEEQERGGLTLSGINLPDPAGVEKVLGDVARRARLSVTRPPNGSITVPFLAAKHKLAFDGNHLLDRYFDEISRLFEFDSDACCATKPYPDETVFHLRNFKAEVHPATAERMGFKELGPKQAANDLLGHLHPGDKVAVLSRFPSDEVDQYLAALRNRGLEVRFISGQTSRQDFCFLLSAQKEMVGVSISTYFYWAARLSNARRVVTYSLDIPSVWGRRGKAFFNYNYTHPRLAGRRQWVFRLFRPDESSNATVGRSIVART